MLGNLKPGTGFAAALALTSIAWANPAYAECIVEGIAYRVMHNEIDDPTGPTIYIKESPHDSFYYFVRLRDGRFINESLTELGQVRVLVHGSALSCPTEGIVRDAGTAIREPQVIEFAARVHDID
jgi:hypothetical protein